MKIEKPKLRGHFHQAMFFISLGACSLLIAKSSNTKQLIAASIYSAGLLLMFGVSALYHRVNWSEGKRALMKKLDHSAIYIMIAGTCTPITLLVLSGKSGLTLLISIWAVAILGVMQSIFFVNLPKFVSSLLYLIPGYMVAPYIMELMPKLGEINTLLLIIGGIIYTLGAVSYGVKRPVLNPKIFGYHEVFHVLVSIGAIVHFVLIYSVIN